MDFYRQYLERLEADGGFDCTCGRRHRIGTRDVLVGEKVLEDLPALLRDRYGRDLRVWVLSDDNTERAAGARCKELLSGWSLSATVLAGSPKPRPTLELAEELTRQAGGHSPGLVLAVGSGVLSDLGKKVAHDLGVPSWCVATAPSVDAYSSGNSVFKSGSRHRTIWVTPSEAIFCELPVMASAPPEMFRSGLGDLLAKFLVYLDWNLSSLVSGEYICPEAVRIARESSLRPLAMLKPGQDTHAVLPALTDALLTTGFLMQALGNSRPASSAEHVAAHIWELAGLVGNASLNLHGLLVALGSRCVLEVYREFYRGLPSLTVDIPARLRALAAEPSWEEHLDPAMSAFADHIRAELGAAELGPAAWQRRLTAFEREKERIRRLAEETLRDLEAGVAALRAIGLPFDPQDYGIGSKDAYLPFPHIRLLRNRYNTFWLMHELGLEDEPLKALRRLVGLS